MTELKVIQQPAAVKGATAAKNETIATTGVRKAKANQPTPSMEANLVRVPEMNVDGPDEIENTDHSPIVSEEIPDNTGEAWTEVISRDTQRRISNAKKSLEELRARIDEKSNRVFCVLVLKRTWRVVEGSTVFEGSPFDDGMPPVCAEFVRMFPFARPISKNGKIQVRTNTVNEANEVMKITVLRTPAVITRCTQLEQHWTRTTKVDRGFSELDIRTTLDSIGVTEFRRETAERRINGELIPTPTDGVLKRSTRYGRTRKKILQSNPPRRLTNDMLEASTFRTRCGKLLEQPRLQTLWIEHSYHRRMQQQSETRQLQRGPHVLLISMSPPSL